MKILPAVLFNKKLSYKNRHNTENIYNESVNQVYEGCESNKKSKKEQKTSLKRNLTRFENPQRQAALDLYADEKKYEKSQEKLLNKKFKITRNDIAQFFDDFEDNAVLLKIRLVKKDKNNETLTSKIFQKADYNALSSFFMKTKHLGLNNAKLICQQTGKNGANILQKALDENDKQKLNSIMTQLNESKPEIVVFKNEAFKKKFYKFSKISDDYNEIWHKKAAPGVVQIDYKKQAFCKTDYNNNSALDYALKSSDSIKFILSNASDDIAKFILLKKLNNSSYNYLLLHCTSYPNWAQMVQFVASCAPSGEILLQMFEQIDNQGRNIFDLISEKVGESESDDEKEKAIKTREFLLDLARKSSNI